MSANVGGEAAVELEDNGARIAEHIHKVDDGSLRTLYQKPEENSRATKKDCQFRKDIYGSLDEEFSPSAFDLSFSALSVFES